MELYEVMRTMGSVREFQDRPVPPDVLHRIFENARFAGSGGNRQGWHVIVVESPEIRAEVTRLSVIGFREYMAQTMAGAVPFGPGSDGRWHGAIVDLAEARATDGPSGLAASIEHAPALLVVVADLSALAITDIDANHVSIIGGASIYPFVHNILLAARHEGLAGVLTTFACRAEAEMRTLLALPDSHAIAAVIPLGFPVHQPTKLKRKAVEEFVTIDRFDGTHFV